MEEKGKYNPDETDKAGAAESFQVVTDELPPPYSNGQMEFNTKLQRGTIPIEHGNSVP